MNSNLLLLLLCTFSMSILNVLCGVEDGSFLETEANFGRIHRNLLQTDEEVEEVSDDSDGAETVENKIEEKEEVKPPKKGLFEEGEELKGPEHFHAPNFPFLMGVKRGVIIEKEGGPEYLGEANAVTGGTGIDDTRSSVSIDWKDSNTILKMTFNSTKTDFVLQEMSLHRGSTIVELHVKTSHGYKVNAPKGLAWACDSPGMFKAKTITGGIKGVTLPEVRLQVSFPSRQLNYGPLWYCGELMPIALWVGLIVTIFFALVCYWGFSMLANIQTMDRFDDPKGKQIHVPQTE